VNTTRSLRLPPQVGQPSTTRAMMADMLVALLPSLAMAVFFFGVRVLALTAVSVASCVASEFLYRKLTRQTNTIRDLSACVTGVLLAMCLPATASYWVPVLGGFFSIVLIKQFYGGLGRNFMNPALGGRMLLATFPMLMTKWSQPLDRLSLIGLDAMSAATPLGYLHTGKLPPQSLDQLLLGYQGGCMGEVSSLMLLLGGFYLILRRVISPRIPLSFLGTAAALALLFPADGIAPLSWMFTHLLSGGLLLGAFFLATDPTTSPVTPRGQLLFGSGCGALTMLLRFCSSYPEGVGWAILTMNCGVWMLDRAGMPRRFGTERFSAFKSWGRRTLHDLSDIRFVKPNVDISFIKEGKMPGEAHLDQIRSAAKSAGAFAGVFLVTALLLSGVHLLTDLNTARAETQAQQALLAKIMPRASFRSETPYRAPGALSIQAAYSKDNELIGYCVEVQSQGFRGVITIDVGVDLDGRVTGVAVTDHKETPRVGTAAMSVAALERYVGKSGTIRSSGSNAVNAISGATATSNAITAGVNRALAIVANLDTEGGDISYVDGEV